MAQQTQKKAWVTPELIVLVRNRPEEAVLATCKTLAGATPSGPGLADRYCEITEGKRVF